MTTTPMLPEEERLAGASSPDAYRALVARLSAASVDKHFDAYADIAWDAPEMRIDREDPRWMLPEDDHGLGATAWYRAQPEDVRARIGLHMVAAFMKVGLQFENVLSRGLLDFASRLPNGAPEYRYALHEVIEESHHSLMFQEFVNRAGMEVGGLNWWQRVGAAQVIRYARVFPELFFVFVLGGEDPIDHVQRRALQSGRDIHPLLRRIMQIHVTEEARHLCFARHYLRRRVPELGVLKRTAMSQQAPVILGIMSQMMMRPSADVVRAHGIPRAVLAEAYERNPAHRARTVDALAKVRGLLEEIGLVTPAAALLWRAVGLGAAAA
jgi:hypothetical protein